MGTPPPDESLDRLPSTPLFPAPVFRRQAPEMPEQPADNFEYSAIPVEEQRGFSWLANYPRDPLRALCLHHNVMKAVDGAGHPLPQTLDMEVIRDAQLPTHVLALSPIQASATGRGSYPLMVPIVAEIWGKKLTVPLPAAPPGLTPPAPRWDATQQRPRQLITLPVIPLEVPHPETVPILLLFALGLEPLPNMLASCLLPADAVGEFPAAYEMSNVMAKNHSIAEIISYVEQNRHIWENALNLGVKDEKIISIVGKAWKVTARARDKLYVR
ncbi:hypothetical protein PILCRDRAFT_828948 [Piloderma croceum F 1598]|uniref:Uncharacterized protein n=1 Tax=Piloderma croceum (strain F 1598) TaxID=765440 RepID=A0A0C3F0I1_PILCF|nr:hypothetical protein PILCRDRAFT_828948 [Piloderma croceum F 1598]